VAGCGDSGPKMYPVSGTVTFDDQPIPEGDIVFLPEEKQFGPDAGKIKDGKYAFRAKGGKKKVQIQASRLIPGKKGPMGEPAREDYIPPRYNTKTELTADVGSGTSEFNFNLKSK